VTADPNEHNSVKELTCKLHMELLWLYNMHVDGIGKAFSTFSQNEATAGPELLQVPMKLALNAS
jgi:hypothetical protein